MSCDSFCCVPSDELSLHTPHSTTNLFKKKKKTHTRSREKKKKRKKRKKKRKKEKKKKRRKKKKMSSMRLALLERSTRMLLRSCSHHGVIINEIRHQCGNGIRNGIRSGIRSEIRSEIRSGSVMWTEAAQCRWMSTNGGGSNKTTTDRYSSPRPLPLADKEQQQEFEDLLV